MNRQRNNIASLPYELRAEISRLLFEGRSYSEVRDAAVNGGAKVGIHNTSIRAWQQSDEYREYVAARKGFDTESRKSRLAASIQAAGNGPGALADVAAYELLQRVLAMVPSADDEAAAAKLAAAISGLRRTQIAAHVAADQSRLSALERKLAEQAAAAAAREAQLQATIAELQTGGAAVDPVAVADRLRAHLGLAPAIPAGGKP